LSKSSEIWVIITPKQEMTNSDIIDSLELTAKLLELHDSDDFLIKTYNNAAFNLDKFTGEIANLSFSDLNQIQGVGKMMATKILEMVKVGASKELDELLSKTPEGVLQMFKIKGIGAKKIKIIWKELGIDNLNDLQIACENGSIAKIKGFGEKTQASILESLIFVQSQAGKLRMDKAEVLANIILEELKREFQSIEITGQITRKSETVDSIQFIAPFLKTPRQTIENQLFTKYQADSSPFIWRGKFADNQINVEVIQVSENQFVNKKFLYSAAENHLKQRNQNGQTLMALASTSVFNDETQIYEKFGSPYILPEMREGWGEFEWVKNHQNEELVTWDSLKGILHNHSTYSDGRHTLEQMVNHCRELGFEYFGIADHSQSAAYANGLLTSRVYQQHEEIDKINNKFKELGINFKVLKGIESDILGDGSLDYPDEVLSTFDYVVASVHSNLNMNITKATDRLLRAIENPYTTILGHPTGRLLLSRQGYPIDYKTIIDACSEKNVVIEINASPYRLDLDWRWIQYCIEKNVMLSINPDAHEMDGFLDMHYGVAVARKGGLTTKMTFNALSLSEIDNYLAKKHPK
jgi:DNA polymerase (family 10)